MTEVHTWLNKLRFYSSTVVIYGLTVAFAWYVLQPAGALAAEPAAPAPITYTQVEIPKVEGTPVRIVLPASGIDLPIDPGDYDPVNKTWTLSGYHAHYATISTPANNKTGETFIYGHNNNHVFGAIRKVNPDVGAPALIYTDNGHVFEYGFKTVETVGANDQRVLNKKGAPKLTVLTCTGALNELRTFYTFEFVRVVQ